jgi:hypothetical protein
VLPELFRGVLGSRTTVEVILAERSEPLSPTTWTRLALLNDVNAIYAAAGGNTYDKDVSGNV